MTRVLLVLLMVVVAACTKNASDPTPAQFEKLNAEAVAKIYPHSDEFKKTNHGRIYRDEKMVCAKCHGVDGKGGPSGVSCNTCHEQYPHGANWGLPLQHGLSFLKLADEKKGAQCLNCHADSGEKRPEVTCQKCHAVYPHSDEFKYGGHKVFAVQKNQACSSCHSNVKERTPEFATEGMECKGCHVAPPHQANWALPTNHGAEFLSSKESCMACHSGIKPTSGVSCYQCHKVFPHPEGMLAPSVHGPLATKHTGKCLICHEGYKKNFSKEMEEGCMTCHGGKDLIIEWHEAKPPEKPAKPGASVKSRSNSKSAQKNRPKKTREASQ